MENPQTQNRRGKLSNKQKKSITIKQREAEMRGERDEKERDRERSLP
jgi:hypothetical protein